MSKFIILTLNNITSIRWIQPESTIRSRVRHAPRLIINGVTNTECLHAESLCIVDISENSESVNIINSCSNKTCKVYYRIGINVKFRYIQSDMLPSLIRYMVDDCNESLRFDTEDDAISFLMM